MTRHIRHIVAAIILLLLSVSLALGASLTVSDSGNGVFTVEGNNMDEVAAIDLTLSYDTAGLASPSVSQGSLISGAMMAANTNNPGSIRIAIAKQTSFSGSGTVVTITFATHSGGVVKIASQNLIDGNLNTVPSGSSTSTTSGFNSSPGIPFSPPPTSNPTTNPTTNPPPGNPGSSGPTYLGTVTMPSDSQPQNETKPAPATETTTKPAEPPASAQAPTPREAPAPAKPAAAPKKAGAIGTASNTAVLERFRVYQGVKTPAIMIALFKQPISPSFRQEPFVALSDGTTTVTIAADLSAEAGGSPNFALNGAKLVSLKKDDASSTWFIEALPVKGALSASLMVLSEDHVTEYPLTIAPAIPNAASTEAEFAAFLKDAAKTPARHDVNGDGTYDGIDDYIYTANYLVRQQNAQPAAK